MNWNLHGVVRYLQRMNSTTEGMYNTLSCRNYPTNYTVYVQSGSVHNYKKDIEMLLKI